MAEMFIATMGFLAIVWVLFWLRFRDPFHPLIVFLPQFGFLYGYMPYALNREDPARFFLWVGGEDVYRYQAITLGLIVCLILGVVRVTGSMDRAKACWQLIPVPGASSIRMIAVGLGLVSWSAWLYMVHASGGFEAAYGSAYGGGWVSSGYIREMRFVGLAGGLLIYLLRVGRGMRLIDWILVVLCVAPTLFHAVLGARRGPAFLSLIVLVGGYIYFMRKKIPVFLVLGGGALAAVLMLFLVANRTSLYLGSELTDLRNPYEHMLRWESNEYLIGAAAVRYADTYGAFYGRRQAAWIVGRILPRSVWPNVYVELPQMLGIDVDLRRNGGVSREGIASVSNFEPTVGAAEAFTGGLWMEFGIFSFLVAFLIGRFYGSVWKQARTRLSARVIYLLMVALTIYLITQALDPWLYRLIFYGVPILLIIHFANRTTSCRNMITEEFSNGGPGEIASSSYTRTNRRRPSEMGREPRNYSRTRSSKSSGRSPRNPSPDG